MSLVLLAGCSQDPTATDPDTLTVEVTTDTGEVIIDAHDPDTDDPSSAAEPAPDVPSDSTTHTDPVNDSVGDLSRPDESQASEVSDESDTTEVLDVSDATTWDDTHPDTATHDSDSADDPTTHDYDPTAPPDLTPLEPFEVVITESFFEPRQCSVLEGCVGGSGWRRLLRFSLGTLNVGGDLIVGRPLAENGFVYDACREHMIVENYATDFELVDAGGAVVASGRKRSFCLADSRRHDESVLPFPRYDCDYQGISRGWYDYYSFDLPCQWVDVTDVPGGNYTLFVHSNPTQVFAESNYDNNTSSAPVRLPSR